MHGPLNVKQENKSDGSMQTIETKRCLIIEQKAEKLNTPAGFTKAIVVWKSAIWQYGISSHVCWKYTSSEWNPFPALSRILPVACDCSLKCDGMFCWYIRTVSIFSCSRFHCTASYLSGTLVDVIIVFRLRKKFSALYSARGSLQWSERFVCVVRLETETEEILKLASHA